MNKQNSTLATESALENLDNPECAHNQSTETLGGAEEQLSQEQQQGREKEEEEEGEEEEESEPSEEDK